MMRRKRLWTGFSLIEVTLALGVAAVCLIAAFGLLPIGVQTNRNATSQTVGSSIIAAVIADLRATPTTRTTSSQFGITFGINPPTLYFDGAGQVSSSLVADSRYQLNITWNASAPTGLKYADLKLTWPAAATPANATGALELFAAFDRN
jgi:uncharacterized protein (TIGR02598 family)